MVWEADADDPAARFIVSAPNWKDWSSAEHARARSRHLGVHLRFNIAGGARARAGVRAARVVERVPDARRRAAARAHVHRGGGRAGPRRRRHQRRPVAPPLRRAPGRHRPDDAGQRRAVRDRRRHAGVVPVPAAHVTRSGCRSQFTPHDGERSAHSFSAAARLRAGRVASRRREPRSRPLGQADRREPVRRQRARRADDHADGRARRRTASRRRSSRCSAPSHSSC